MAVLPAARTWEESGLPVRPRLRNGVAMFFDEVRSRPGFNRSDDLMNMESLPGSL